MASGTTVADACDDERQSTLNTAWQSIYVYSNFRAHLTTGYAREGLGLSWRRIVRVARSLLPDTDAVANLLLRW